VFAHLVEIAKERLIEFDFEQACLDEPEKAKMISLISRSSSVSIITSRQEPAGDLILHCHK